MSFSQNQELWLKTRKSVSHPDCMIFSTCGAKRTQIWSSFSTKLSYLIKWRTNIVDIYTFSLKERVLWLLRLEMAVVSLNVRIYLWSWIEASVLWLAVFIRKRNLCLVLKNALLSAELLLPRIFMLSVWWCTFP